MSQEGAQLCGVYTLLLWSTTALARHSSTCIAGRRRRTSRRQPIPTPPRSRTRDAAAERRRPHSPAALPDDECDRRHRPAALAAVGAQRQAQQRPDRRRDRRCGHRQAARHRRLRHGRAHSRHPGRRASAAKRTACSLRGLDRTFYTTTYNGREIFTAETRSVALQDFPSGAIAALEAFKTSTAEPDRAGHRGPDQRPLAPAVRLQGLRGRRLGLGHSPATSRATGTPNGNLLITDRWNVGDGEMGALINFSYTRLHYQDSISAARLLHRRPTPRAAARRTGRKSIMTRATRRRPSVNGAMQYRPTRTSNSTPKDCGRAIATSQRPPCGSSRSGAARPTSNIVFRDNSNEIVSGTRRPSGQSSMQTWGFQGATNARRTPISSRSAAATTPDRCGSPATLRAPTAHSQLRTESVDFELNNNNYSVDWYTGLPGQRPGPTFQVTGIDPTDPANYDYRGFFEDHADREGQGLAGAARFRISTRTSISSRRSSGACATSTAMRPTRLDPSTGI